ncbi:MAG: ABC transporter substrate-binding protein [Burkholderiaceae bacterium]
MRALLLAACLAGAAAAAQTASDAAQVARGEAIYVGDAAAYARPGAARVGGAPIPPQSAACVACHRRSGLGSAESNLIVPPIAGHLLFNPLSPQTGKRLPWPSRDRTRPAYDEASLARALADGVAPDGVPLAAPMPRYAFTAEEVAALAAYLRTLSVATAPGVTDEEVVFATVTTPEVPAAQVDDLLRTLRALFADRNAGTRHETRRRAQALRTDSTMYRRFRRWRLEHWALTGEPHTWLAQLEARYAATPVFALLSGLSYDDWTPVHAFCERARVPCVLPNVALPPQREDFYSIYLSPGLAAEAQATAAALAGTREVVLWSEPGASGERRRAVIEAAFARQGIAVAERAPRADDVIVAALPAERIESRWRALAEPPRRVYALGAMLAELPDAWQPQDAALRERSVLVTPLAADAAARRQMARSRAWLAARGLRPSSERIAANALLAAIVATEMMMHVDDRFSREYCIEQIEHNLENVPPLTAYPRLSIGPAQRFAARRVHLHTAADARAALAADVRPRPRLADPALAGSRQAEHPAHAMPKRAIAD